MLYFKLCFCQVTRNVMRASLPLPPGDIYNLTVTACTERSRNTSMPNIIKLGQSHWTLSPQPNQNHWTPRTGLKPETSLWRTRWTRWKFLTVQKRRAAHETLWRLFLFQAWLILSEGFEWRESGLCYSMNEELKTVSDSAGGVRNKVMKSCSSRF